MGKLSMIIKYEKDGTRSLKSLVAQLNRDLESGEVTSEEFRKDNLVMTFNNELFHKAVCKKLRRGQYSQGYSQLKKEVSEDMLLQAFTERDNTEGDTTTIDNVIHILTKILEVADFDQYIVAYTMMR